MTTNKENEEKPDPLMSVHANKHVYCNTFRSYVPDVGRVEVVLAYEPEDWDEVDPELLDTFEKLGISLRLKDD